MLRGQHSSCRNIKGEPQISKLPFINVCQIHTIHTLQQYVDKYNGKYSQLIIKRSSANAKRTAQQLQKY